MERGIVLEKKWGEEDDRNEGGQRWMYQIAENEEKGRVEGESRGGTAGERVDGLEECEVKG
ncbi:hypothetical protein [Saliphagus sp. LR7]|uniref:hypothetical protein n=1 Tax=Saliphagus sp. LR7 TaxID=2282654 RepID=UPI000DF8066E|nr:hypothetical protein [Saliphagus sp. LR7]